MTCGVLIPYQPTWELAAKELPIFYSPAEYIVMVAGAIYS
jgi:hypothetical protein